MENRTIYKCPICGARYESADAVANCVAKCAKKIKDSENKIRDEEIEKAKKKILGCYDSLIEAIKRYDELGGKEKFNLSFSHSDSKNSSYYIDKNGNRVDFDLDNAKISFKDFNFKKKDNSLEDFCREALGINNSKKRNDGAMTFAEFYESPYVKKFIDNYFNGWKDSRLKNFDSFWDDDSFLSWLDENED